jgi:hypothetical protein
MKKPKFRVNSDLSRATVIDTVTGGQYDLALRISDDREELVWCLVVGEEYIPTYAYLDVILRKKSDREETFVYVCDELMHAVDMQPRYILKSDWHNTDLKEPSRMRKNCAHMEQSELDRILMTYFGSTDPLRIKQYKDAAK